MLEDDTDLAMMNLTRMLQSPEDYLPPLSTEVLEDHEEMELLLEAYLQVGTPSRVPPPTPPARASVHNRLIFPACSRHRVLSRLPARGCLRAAAPGCVGLTLALTLSRSCVWVQNQLLRQRPKEQKD